MEKLEEFFKLKERGTSVKIEVLAGITTFMTMAYVLVVQPGAIIGFGDAVSFTDINGLVITKEQLRLHVLSSARLLPCLWAFTPTCPLRWQRVWELISCSAPCSSPTPCPLAPSWP